MTKYYASPRKLRTQYIPCDTQCELRCLLQNWQTIRPEWNQLSLDNGLNGKKKENQENRGQEGHHHQPRPPRITSALVNSPGRMHHRSYSPSWLVFYEMWSGPRPLIIYFHISAMPSRARECWAAELATWGERGRPEIILAKVTYIALFLRIQESKLKS